MSAAKTIVRITIPAGENIKLAKMAEFTSPGGMSCTLTLPFPMAPTGLSKIIEAFEAIGGSVEILNE